MPYEQRERAPQPLKRPSGLTLENRKHLTVSGVEEVVSFDEREIVIRTVEGDLCVHGEGMTISKLSVDNGDVHIHGLISQLRYEESAPERGLWARLFR